MWEREHTVYLWIILAFWGLVICCGGFLAGALVV